MSNGKPPARYHHGDLRNVLLEAAETLLERQGPAGLSLREVARVAGVSHAAPYRHFRDKSALLQALSRSGFEHLRLAIERATAGATQNPEQQLVEAGVAYVDQAARHPEMFRLMFGAVPQGPNSEAGQAIFDALAEITRDGIACGAFRPRNAGELALAAWTSMHGLAMLAAGGQLPVAVHGGAQLLDDASRALARTVLYGITR